MNSKTPFSVKTADDSTGFLLWQATMVWQRCIAATLRPHALTQVQFALLASLMWLSRSKRFVTQSVLAGHARLDVTMTSQVLRTLEARGLIERNSHPSDARAKTLTLTTRGRALARAAVPVVERADTDFFAGMGSTIGTFNKALRGLIKSSS